jgi:hypothetical protein
MIIIIPEKGERANLYGAKSQEMFLLCSGRPTPSRPPE